MKLDSPSVLITGAGSGIGRETALAFARKGARITLSGRRREPLQQTAEDIARVGGEAEVFAGDMRDSKVQEQLIEAALDRFGELNVLVNNAGVVRAGRLELETDEELLAQVETNLLAPIRLTREALPSLRLYKPSAIINVSSGFGLFGMAFYATYSATKAGIARFSEALRRELHGTGVHVMTVYPGATETPMMETAGLGAEHGVNYESAEAVAQALVAGLENDEIEVVRSDRTLVRANWEDPAAVDEQLAAISESLEQATAWHRHL
jgi:uncharacterized oxidoreductase